MYFTATKDVRDHKGNVVTQARELSKARRKRVQRAVAMREGGAGSKPVNDQTGIGYR